MNWLRVRYRRVVVVVVPALLAAVFLALPSADAARKPPSRSALEGARIMLVNDDSVQAAKVNGADGRGLYVLRAALCRAGADVVVVGPWGQQSGRSRATAASPQVRVAPPLGVPARFAADCSAAPSRGAVLGVCQGADPCGPSSASVTPADAVDVALSALLGDRFGWSNGPDLVLSGINSGANTDLAVNLSGTVGAAVAAVEHRVPGIAVSAGTRATSIPDDASYEAAADYTTGLVARLLAGTGAERLVRDSVIVNVNCPDVRAGVTPAPRWTAVGQVALDRLSYAKSAADIYQMSYGPASPAPVPDAGSDTAALLRGELSVGAVSVNRDASADARWLSALIGNQ
ncbi:stationary phase survival protein SurE [Amycolatopsis sp. K13G38]|uniref:5'-nucleotidase n=1 Tax=Amycolatopsis acididurans TaxID=2724524 RepID=A0ABX1JBC4_9PSEU|nr:5'/3'-nucleotidase SurE [Amycolatopsis acididurans]NKQ57066.1 stationary phase survival protein SurE [Amycolatopsis acididurans]